LKRHGFCFIIHSMSSVKLYHYTDTDSAVEILGKIEGKQPGLLPKTQVGGRSTRARNIFASFALLYPQPEE